MVPHLKFQDIEVDLLRLRVCYRGNDIHFTLAELRLLLAFLVEPYKTFTREELIELLDIPSSTALHQLTDRVRLLLGEQYVFMDKRCSGYSFLVPTKHPRKLEREDLWTGNRL